MIKINWGTSILIFLILFVLAGFYFVYFSFQHHNDLVVDDYYEQGANYEKQMTIDKRSLIFQDSIQLTDTAQFVSINLASSIADMTDSVHAFFYFPPDKRNDYTIHITDFSGNTLVDKNNLSNGRYTLQLSWFSGADKFMISKDFFVTK